MGLQKPTYTQIPNDFIDKYMCEISKEAALIFIAICRKTIGWHKDTDIISQSQLLKITPIKSVNGLKKAIKELLDKDLIVVEQSGTGKNTKTVYEIKFQSDDNISCHDTIDMVNVSSHDTKSKTNVSYHDTTKESININKEYKYIDILTYWNSKKIIIHRENIFLKSIQKKHKDKIELYGIDAVQKAIDNYSTVLSSEKYYWSHRWTLLDFLQRGIDKFIPEAKPLNNYLKKGYKDEVIEPVEKYLCPECSKETNGSICTGCGYVFPC